MIKQTERIRKMKINIVQGDIFSVSCDACVNPTDVGLSGSGGLDRAIHQKCGAALEQECAPLRGNMKPGMTVVTSGCGLPVKYILHTVSPKCADEKTEDYENLRDCYFNILRAASEKSGEIRHLAVPLVGTGRAGYSMSGRHYGKSLKSLTAVTILSSIVRFFAENIHYRMIEEITIVCSSQEKYECMKETYRWIFGKGLSKRERIRGSLLGGAIGDALGYPVEFRSGREALIKDYILDEETGLALISDDTQMTLFTACGLLWGHTRGCMRGIGADYWHYIKIAYMDWLKTQIPEYNPKTPVSWIRNIPQLNELRAPGNTCLSALETGGGSLEEPVNNSKGNGAVMRIAPVPLYGAANRHWGQEYNALVCAETSAITHGHPLGWLSAVALGNLLYDIMLNFSLAYSVEDTVQFLRKNYAEYPETERMIALIEEAELLAGMTGYTSSTDLIAEFDIMEKLGEGWVGEEALAVSLFCVLATAGIDVEHCLWNAVGNRGDSDSMGSIAGQIWGAYFGERAFPSKWLEKLELRSVIEEIADDLASDCQMSEYSSYVDPAWVRKYLSGQENTHVPGPGEEARRLFVQRFFEAEPSNSFEVRQTGSDGSMKTKYRVVLKDGKLFHVANTKEDAHTGFHFGVTDQHYDAERRVYAEGHGWVRYYEDDSVEGDYCNISFQLIPNRIDHTLEIFGRTRDRLRGTVRRRIDEWGNPMEIELKGPFSYMELNLPDVIALAVRGGKFEF